jgi:hypothetical protein
VGIQADILDLHRRFGISYKDAAHRLYMAELERLKKADSVARFAGALEGRLERIVAEDIAPAISAIDEGRFDSYCLREGEWTKNSEEGGGPSRQG